MPSRFSVGGAYNFVNAAWSAFLSKWRSDPFSFVACGRA